MSRRQSRHVSVVAALATFVWLVAFGVPYPLLLAVLFALLDLVPVIGSLVAGALVALAAMLDFVRHLDPAVLRG